MPKLMIRTLPYGRTEGPTKNVENLRFYLLLDFSKLSMC